jgi:hypothetical protein
MSGSVVLAALVVYRPTSRRRASRRHAKGCKMDALVLPALLVLIVAFFIGVWIAWLKDERALKMDAGEDDTPS